MKPSEQVSACGGGEVVMTAQESLITRTAPP